VGQRVEIVGDIDDELEKGKLEIDHEGDVTRIEFRAAGHHAVGDARAGPLADAPAAHPRA